MGVDKRKPRFLSSFNLTILGLGNALGVGIFVLLGHLTTTTGPAAVVSIVISGLTAILSGLCFAEFGTRFVRTDSVYSYGYAYHGENVAFVLGWALILEYVTGGASIAKGILTLTDALAKNQISTFLKGIVPICSDLSIPYLDFFSPIITLVLFLAVLVGLKDSVFVHNLFNSFTLVLVVAIIAAGSFKADLTNWDLPQSRRKEGEVPTFSQSFAPFGYLAVLKSAALGFYGFIGYDTMAVSGRELRSPQVSIPFANQIAICLVMIFYANSAVILTLISPYEDHILGAALPFAFERLNWAPFKWVIVVVSFFAFYTSLTGTMFPLLRVVNSMANDSLLFHCLGNGYAAGKASKTAILFGAFLTFFPAAIFDFEILVRLAVVATLFVSVILALDVVVLRYAPNAEPTRSVPTEVIAVSQESNSLDSHENFAKLLFDFKSTTPTKLTEKIVVINLVLFCIASIGLAVILTFFTQLLQDVAAEVIVPTVLLIIIMFLNVISISCQPKSRILPPFKVPIVPLIPCLFIFLSIFLIVLLGPLTIVYFSVWMAAGLLPHMLWYGYKCRRGDLRNTSLYEINKLNSIKLNESIWKINSDKKSFYEGAVNPVFENDDGEVTFATCSITNTNNEGTEIEVRKSKKAKKGAKKEPNKVDEDFQVEDDVQWKCIAEVHTPEDVPEECYEVKVVNRTYNFLSEDYGKDENSSTSSGRVLDEDVEEDVEGKAFKDKLNVLLKNQINMSESLRNVISRYMNSPDEDSWNEAVSNDRGAEEGVPKTIKTLNKSQMKNTLEILLAQGPPKRFSLRRPVAVKVDDDKSTTEVPKSA